MSAAPRSRQLLFQLRSRAELHEPRLLEADRRLYRKEVVKGTDMYEFPVGTPPRTFLSESRLLY